MGFLAPEADAYDRAGQLTRIQDSGKGERNYRYDPVGRLTESLSPLGREKFAFDPASNLVDTKQRDIQREEGAELTVVPPENVVQKNKKSHVDTNTYVGNNKSPNLCGI
jgi:YD repeat-containing protein